MSVCDVMFINVRRHFPHTGKYVTAIATGFWNSSITSLFKRLEIKEFYFRQLVCYNRGKNGHFVQF